MFFFQVNTAPVIAERCGLKTYVYLREDRRIVRRRKHRHRARKGLVESGNADIVMVAGGEKLLHPSEVGNLLQRALHR